MSPLFLMRFHARLAMTVTAIIGNPGLYPQGCHMEISLGFCPNLLLKKETCIPAHWSHAVSSSIDFGRTLKNTDVGFLSPPSLHILLGLSGLATP